MTNLKEALEALDRIHDGVDGRARAIAESHGSRIVCARGCFDCCVDELTVFEIEAEKIRRDFPELLEFAEPHPPGRCVFIGETGECRIYESRPYVCRTQGLPLRWLDETEVEYRDICPLNDEEGDAVETLDEERCWTIGPTEDALRRLQASLDGGELRRVALRDVFTK